VDIGSLRDSIGFLEPFGIRTGVLESEKGLNLSHLGLIKVELFNGNSASDS
jgi:hypothetical protein